MIIFKIDLDFL